MVALAEGADDRANGRRLLPRRFDWGCLGLVTRRNRRSFHQFLGKERGERGAFDAESGEFGIGGRSEFVQPLERVALGRCSGECRVGIRSVRSEPPDNLVDGLGLGAPPRLDRHHRLEDIPDRMVVVAGEPSGEIHEVRRQQRLVVDDVLDGLQFVRGRVADIENYAHDVSTSERCANACSG